MFNIKDYQRYLECDEPVPYKSMFVYPVKIKDYYEFLEGVTCLSIDKDQMGPDISAMSYLDFLLSLYISDEYGESIRSKFNSICKLCFHLEPGDFYFDVDDNDHLIFCVGEDAFKKREFDELRKIILNQNFPDYDDTYIDPELAKALEDEWELRSRKSGRPSFGDQINAMCVLTGFTFDYIYSMPIRRFFLVLGKAIAKMEYQMARTAEMSGMVEFKSPIKDWIPSEKKNFLAERSGQYDEVKKKIGTK
jgi:hypothetical protein